MQANQQDDLTAWNAYRRAYAQTIHAVDRALNAREGVGLPAHEALACVGAGTKGRLRMTRLAECVGLSPSAATRLVDQLEREGWVVRERCPADLRGFEVALTPAGRAKARTTARAYRDAVREHFSGRCTRAELASLGRASESLLQAGRRGALTGKSTRVAR